MVHSVFLYPLEGQLDVASIERFLAQQPDVLIDPLGTGIYLVCGLPEAVETYRDLRLADPSRFALHGPDDGQARVGEPVSGTRRRGWAAQRP
jgi:hypothetical protein